MHQPAKQENGRKSMAEWMKPRSNSEIEWWYFYSFLQGDKGGRYSLVVAFFEVGWFRWFKGHYLIASLTNLNEKKSEHCSLLDRKLQTQMVLAYLPGHLFRHPQDKAMSRLLLDLLKNRLPSPHKFIGAAVQANPASLSYGPLRLTFSHRNAEFEMRRKSEIVSLKFQPNTPLIQIGEQGKPDDLFYDTYPRNQVVGYIKHPFSIESLRGSGWIDHQWGNPKNLFTSVGWNWFGIQLDNGAALLINQFRNIETGENMSAMAELIHQDGRSNFTRNVTLTPNVILDSKAASTSKAGMTSKSAMTSTAAPGSYPLQWQIQIPEFGYSITVTGHMDYPNQHELPVIGPLQAIWEGPCTVVAQDIGKFGGKSLTGRGFMELVGYANSNIPN